MNDLIDWLGKLRAPRRNHFFFGKMMGVEQFETEQRYGMSQRWLGNRLTLGTGVLCGLELSLSQDSKRIRVSRGVAVDPQGREIIVPRWAELDPFKESIGCCDETREVPTDDGPYQICLHYHECSADQIAVPATPDCDSLPACEADTTVESYSLSLRPAVTSEPFPCAEWLEPMAPISTEEGPAVPPDEAELRRRLMSMLKGSCDAPPASCVVLGTVDITRDGDTLKLGEPSTKGQHPLYTQAQLLDLIVCLAAKLVECCSHPEPTTTLRIQSLGYLRPGATEGTMEETQPRQPLTDPPVFDAISGSRITALLPWKPLFLRFTFNLPVAGSTVQHTPIDPPPTDPPLTDPPSGVVLRAVSGSSGQKVVVPSSAVLEAETSLLVTCSGEPGLYELTLQGSPVGTSPAITTWDVDPAKRQRLDGEPNAAWPSGDGTPEGDFVTMFRLARPVVPMLKLNRVFYGTAGLEMVEASFDNMKWVWTPDGRVLEIQFVFNTAVDAGSFDQVAKFTYDNQSWPRTLDVVGNVVNVSLTIDDPAGNQSLHIALPDNLKGQNGEPFDGERGDALSPQQATVLPTGDGHEGGTFDMQILITVTTPT